MVLQEQKYRKVIESFIGYSKETYNESINAENADRIFIAFLKDHDLDVLFASNTVEQTILPDVTTSNVERFLINSFVKYLHEKDPEIFNFIVDISIGHIIANTLLYRDYEKFQGKLSGNYYLDIGLLFSLMGTNGIEKKVAYKEFADLLLLNGAKLFVFRHTLDEFMGILENCMKRVESRDFEPFRASRALIFFRENGFTSSDVERFILGVSDELEKLKITLIDVPLPMKDVNYQIGEDELTKLIVEVYKEKDPNFDETEKDYTIYQDVRSISAIYKLRRGEKPVKLSEAKHIFITTNSSLAYASKQYEIKSSVTDYFFIPASLTDVFLGTLIWLRSPSKVSEINEKRLIANCYAALQPSKPLLKKFISEVEKLNASGEVSEEDVIILKESRVARNLLQEETLSDLSRFTDRTVTEILEELKTRIEKDAGKKFEKDRKGYLSEIEEKNVVERNFNKTKARIERLATKVANAIFWITVLGLLITITTITIYQLNQQIFGNNRYVNGVLLVVSIGWGIITAYTGFNIRGAGEAIRLKIKVAITRFFIAN